MGAPAPLATRLALQPPCSPEVGVGCGGVENPNMCFPPIGLSPEMKGREITGTMSSLIAFCASLLFLCLQILQFSVVAVVVVVGGVLRVPGWWYVEVGGAA